MTEREASNLTYLVGRLEGTVAEIKQAVQEDRADSRRHREGLKEVIASMSEAVRNLTDQVGGLRDKVDTITPEVEHVRRRRVESQGVLKMWRNVVALWSLVGAIIVSLTVWLAGHLKWSW